MEKYQAWEQQDSLKNVRKYLGLVWRRWYFVLGSLLLALMIGWLINRYESPLYALNAAIITKKFEEPSASVGSLTGLPMGGSYFRQQIEVFQEIPLLKSTDRIRETVDRLDFEVAYFVEGEIKTTEVYGNVSFQVMIDSSSDNVPFYTPFYFENYSMQSFELWSPSPAIQKYLEDRTFRFGSPIEVNGFRFKVIRLASLMDPVSNRYFFLVNNPSNLTNQYRGRLQISWRQQGSAILDLSMLSALPQKDIQFMSKYIEVVVEKGLKEKNEYASNMIRFIDDQMRHITDSLMQFRIEIDDYKLGHRDLLGGSNYVLERLNALDEQKAELELANRYYDYLSKYIKQKRTEEIFAPNLIGLEAPLLDGFVDTYISRKMEDKVALNEENQKNPLVQREDEQIDRLEKNIFENIGELKATNQELIDELDQKSAFYLASVREFQVGSSELMQLERIYNLNEQIFNLLLQKKTDASIARASTTSDYQVVEAPGFSSKPVYPNMEKIFSIAVLLGLGVPIGLIVLFDMLNTKITSREDLQRHVSMPVIGYIGHKRFPEELVVHAEPKSLVSESFRNIRANLKYFVKGGQEGQRVYMVTSSIVGEGKTFCSMNLAYIFAISGKKTLLIGADLRKPALTRYVKHPSGKGLSDYLAGLATLKEIITITELDHLDVLISGTVPPNPAELLASTNTEKLFTELKKLYDYIIIDTPPIGLVSDAMELLKFTDTNILVVRQSVTYKDALQNVNEMYIDGKLKNMVVVFNDVNFKKLSYDYSYRGYGYIDASRTEASTGRRGAASANGPHDPPRPSNRERRVRVRRGSSP